MTEIVLILMMAMSLWETWNNFPGLQNGVTLNRKKVDYIHIFYEEYNNHKQKAKNEDNLQETVWVLVLQCRRAFAGKQSIHN